MPRSLGTIRKNLERVLEILERDSLLPVPGDDRERLGLETRKVLERIGALEEAFLLVGLLGGTGVGKSTLMNALAGKPISSVSHRRPHTDHLIIYRHEQAPALEGLGTLLPVKEIEHQADAVRRVLLCDLPDFDSLLEAHREGVLDFLTQLDLLVWVSSPEKYADSRFYEFLRITPKAQSNFLFVLNKCDQLFDEGDRGEGYGKLEAVSRQFSEHLKSEGIDAPALFTVSSLEAAEKRPLSSWNAFPALSQLVFRQRDAKTIQAIKAENLDVEADRIFNEIREKAKALEDLERSLDEVLAEWKNEQDAWVRSGREILSSWLENVDVFHFIRQPKKGPPLVGPGLFLHSLLSALRREENPAPSQALTSAMEPPEHVQKAFKRRLEWMEDRVQQKMLRKSLPPAIRERLQEIIDVGRRFDRLGERFFMILSSGIPAHAERAGWFFKLRQRVIYSLLLVLLILALGDASAWRGFLEVPSWSSLLHLGVTTVQNLFSQRGLAALGSYALLNLFFAVRFTLRYRSRMRRSGEKALALLGTEMAGAWKETLLNITGDLEALKSETSSRRVFFKG